MTTKKKKISPAQLAQRVAAGNATSDIKARVARKNGKLGGRPGNPEIKRIQKQLGVSRQRAWVIWKQRGGR